MANLMVKKSGNPIQMLSPGEAQIRSLKVYFSPKQEGEGAPSPENVRPITGYEGVKVEHCGKNLVPRISDTNFWNTNAYFMANGNITNNGNYKMCDYKPALPNTEYVFSTSDKSWKGMGFYDSSYNALSFKQSNATSVQLTSPSNAKYYRIYTFWSAANLQFEIGTDPTEYTPYQTRISKVPSEYQEVEYIESTGGAYIPTQFILSMNDVFRADIKFQYMGTKGNNFWIAGVGRNIDNFQFEFGFYGGWWKNNKEATYTSISGDYPNRVMEATMEREYTQNATLNFHIGQRSSFDDEMDNRRIYYMRFRKNNKVISNFIPCYRISDSKPGMYDTVSGNFYTNQGTGEFIPGPAINKYDVNWSEELGTVYGGYVDLVSGELVKEWHHMHIDETSTIGVFPWGGIKIDSTTGIEYASALFIRTSDNPKAVPSHNLHYCNKLPQGGINTINSSYFYDGDSYGPCINLPTSLIGTTNETLKTYLAENPYDFVYQIRTPITIQLSKTKLTTLINSNTFWSNADRIEIEYDLVETDEIQQIRRKMLMNTPHTESVSGNSVNFSTDMRAKVKDCKVYFEPVQEGEGDLSPENVRPIKGWDGITVTQAENLFVCNENTINGITFETIDSNGTIRIHGTKTTNSSGISFSVPFSFPTSRSITVKGHPEYTNDGRGFFIWDNTSRISLGFVKNGSDFTKTLTANHEYVLAIEITINQSVDMTFTPIIIDNTTVTSITIPFPQTVYGGYVDLVNGEVVETWHRHVEDGSIAPRIYPWGGASEYSRVALFQGFKHEYYYPVAETSYRVTISPTRKYWNINTLRNYSDYRFGMYPIGGNGYSFATNYPLDVVGDTKEELQAYLAENPEEFVYPLRTPIHHSLTPQQLITLRGSNFLSHNANKNIEVTYWTH